MARFSAGANTAEGAEGAFDKLKKDSPEPPKAVLINPPG
jgi:hypothetical protein